MPSPTSALSFATPASAPATTPANATMSNDDGSATKKPAFDDMVRRPARRDDAARAQTSRALTLLADKGLVERTPRPSDRREVLLHLSEAGRALYAALLPRIIEINRQLLSTLRADEVLALEGFLQRLQRQAEAMNAPMRRTQHPP